MGRAVYNVLLSESSSLVVSTLKSLTSVKDIGSFPSQILLTVETPTILIWVDPTDTTLPKKGSGKVVVVYETKLPFLTMEPGNIGFGDITLLANTGSL